MISLAFRLGKCRGAHCAKWVALKPIGKVISQEYILEYGRDCLEMHVDAVGHGERALVVDDLIATVTFNPKSVKFFLYPSSPMSTLSHHRGSTLPKSTRLRRGDTGLLLIFFLGLRRDS
ncbi:hypothetical protein Fmac_007508 [Flemingia macrophylla]|uniref:adenine phosphoribosyltransferase n=1 Tax=Flemingia macrophylla TaxID=520843 RepID=A0ABD1MUR1_9FABA